MTRKTSTHPTVPYEERPLPEDLYPRFLSWPSVEGEPIARVLSCLRDLDEVELKEFFNMRSKDFCRLTPAELLCGQPESDSALGEPLATLLKLPRLVRLDMVCGSAARFRELVFRQLREMDGAANDADKRKLLGIRRTTAHLVEAAVAAHGRSRNSRVIEAVNTLHNFSEELEVIISHARDEGLANPHAAGT
jgi:hypothetical protein